MYVARLMTCFNDVANMYRDILFDHSEISQTIYDILMSRNYYREPNPLGFMNSCIEKYCGYQDNSCVKATQTIPNIVHWYEIISERKIAQYTETV